MEFKYNKNITLNKELNALDKFVLDFTNILNKLKIKYVLISGYVSILFGRSRSSEDIDIFIEKINYEKFKELWSKLYRKFECITTEDTKEAYKDYLDDNLAIRFSYKDKYIPNMEIKFPKLEVERWCLDNSKKVILNKKILFVSPIELQIPFKLFLGSEKDVEDAKHLYKIFKDKLDLKLLNGFNRKLKVVDVFNKYIK